MRRLLLGLLLAAAAPTACGESSDDKPARAAARPAPVQKIRAVPERTTPLAEVRDAAITIRTLSWLAMDGSDLFVKRDDGFVTRVDVRTNRITGEVGKRTGADEYCQGIGAGGGAIWSCTRTAITRIDPKRMKIVASIPLAKAFDQGRLVFAAGRLWVVTGANGDELTGIDPATDRPGPPIKLPTGCSDLAQGGAGDVVWVLCPLNDRVVKVDARRGAVAGSLKATAPSAGAATADDAWISTGPGLLRVDAKTLKPQALFAGLGTGTAGDVAADDEEVWVRTAKSFLHRIDARTNAVTDRISAPEGLGGGSVQLARGALWTTADEDATLLRLRR